jgi:hypothetical protein
MARVDGVMGLGTMWVHSVTGSGRTTLLWAWEQRRRLGDGACLVDGVTSS